MDQNVKPAEFRPPIGFASVACVLTMTFMFCVARSAISLVKVWWVEMTIYAAIPILVVFVILYRSFWHQELDKTTRILSMLLTSCIIFCCVLIIAGIVVAAASVFFSGSMVSS
jgi:hypothetical protein